MPATQIMAMILKVIGSSSSLSGFGMTMISVAPGEPRIGTAVTLPAGSFPVLSSTMHCWRRHQDRQCQGGEACCKGERPPAPETSVALRGVSWARDLDVLAFARRNTRPHEQFHAPHAAADVRRRRQTDERL